MEGDRPDEHGNVKSDEMERPMTENSSHKEERPPLPPRPTELTSVPTNEPSTSVLKPGRVVSTRPSLLSAATTAVSRTDIQTHSFQDGSQETYAATAELAPAKKSFSPYGSFRGSKSIRGSRASDAASLRSFAPTINRGSESESVFGDVFGLAQDIPTWHNLDSGNELAQVDDFYDIEERELGSDFYREFDAVETLERNPDGEGTQTANPGWRVLTLVRAAPGDLEGQAQAIHYSLLGRQANLQPPW